MTTSLTNLGASGPPVFPLALGCMGMDARSWYGAGDEAEGIATIHEALERGVNMIDTGDFYSMGRNELLVGKALRGRRDKALLSVKFGALLGPDGELLGHDGRPAATKNALAYTLSRLGVEYIDVYRPARLDPAVPVEDTVGAIADLVRAGYVRYIGLSEVGAETVRRAMKVHAICDVQLEYALVSRSVEARIIPALREFGIAMTAYGVLSRGLLTGASPTSDGDVRSYMPRFLKGNVQQNRPLVQILASIAAARGLSAAQLAVAWVRAKGLAQRVTIIPTVGARTRKQLLEALSSLDVSLDGAEIAALEAAVPASAIAGARYSDAEMAELDSEK